MIWNTKSQNMCQNPIWNTMYRCGFCKLQQLATITNSACNGWVQLASYILFVPILFFMGDTLTGPHFLSNEIVE